MRCNSKTESTPNSYNTAELGGIFVLFGCQRTGGGVIEDIDYLVAIDTGSFSPEDIATITQSTIPELQAAMERGDLSAEQITTFFLGQIEAKNDVLHAVISVNLAAVDTARARDAERTAGKVRGLVRRC